MAAENINKERKKRRESKLDLSTLVYGKVPPQAQDLEETILGAMMLEPNCVHIAISKLFPECFYTDARQRIFRGIQKLFDKGSAIDVTTVVAQLRATEELDICGGAFAIVKLTNSVVSSANIETHILLVLQAYMKREIIRVCGSAINEAYEDGTDSFELVSETDSEIQKVQERVLAGISKDISYFGMKVLEEHASVKETGVIGMSTGILALDKVICGLVAPDMIVMAGRPGQGKTAFALSITHNTSIKNNIPCAWFSFEMSGVQLVRRLASIDTGIDHERIRNGRTTKEEDYRLGESIAKISQSPIYIEDQSVATVRDIRTKSHLLKKKKGIQYIVVDYLQLMGSGSDGGSKNREQVISDISRQLKCLAKELEIPVIALSQLSRAVESRPDKMPQLSDLRESGAIEQDADEVMFLMRPEYYGMTEVVDIGGKEYAPSNLCICSIAKNRHGGTKNIPLHFRAPIMLFSQMAEDEFIRPKSGAWTPYQE